MLGEGENAIFQRIVLNCIYLLPWRCKRRSVNKGARIDATPRGTVPLCKHTCKYQSLAKECVCLRARVYVWLRAGKSITTVWKQRNTKHRRKSSDCLSGRLLYAFSAQRVRVDTLCVRAREKEFSFIYFVAFTSGSKKGNRCFFIVICCTYDVSEMHHSRTRFRECICSQLRYSR